MPRFKYQSHFVDGNGSVVVDGTVTVSLTGTSTAATIYAAESGGAALSGGQTTSDSTDGSFSFWVDTSDHDISQKFRVVLSKSNYKPQTYDDIVVFPKGATDTPTTGKVATWDGMPYTDVRMYGTVGAGVAGGVDDTVAIQSAIDATADGGTIIIPDGDYLIAATGPSASGDDGGVQINKSIRLILSEGAILRAIAGSKTNSHIIKVNAVTTGVEISGGTLIGDKYTNPNVSEQGSGINILNSSNVYIHDIFISKCHGDCIRSAPTNMYPTNQRFERVTFDDGRRWGLSISGGDNHVIQDCIFQNCTQDPANPLTFGGAVDIEDTYQTAYGGPPMQDITFDGCTFIDNQSPNGALTLQLKGSRNINVIRCTFKNNRTYGINAAGDVDGYKIERCSFEIDSGHVTFAGIDSLVTLAPVVRDCTFIGDGTKNAINLGGGALRNLQGVVIANNSFDGFLTAIINSTGTIEGTVIEGNYFKNISASSSTSRGGRFINNYVGENCASITVGTDMVVTNNVVNTQNAATNGISVSGARAIVANNFVKDCTQRGIHVNVGASDCLIVNNIVQSLTGAAIGIFLQSSTNGLPSTVLNNQILGDFTTNESIADDHRYLRFAALSQTKTNAVPDNGLFTLGALVKNGSPAVGSPTGWVCTVAGAAYEDTRADTTAYTVGQWILWDSGTTVWKCTTAGTSGSPAPSIAGLVVGGTVVDGTVTWTMMSLTAATLVAEANL